MSEPVRVFPSDTSRTSLMDMLIQIGANVVRDGRYVALKMAEVAISRNGERVRSTCFLANIPTWRDQA